MKKEEKKYMVQGIGYIVHICILLVLVIGFCIFLIVLRLIMAIMALAGLIFTILLWIYGLTDYFVKFKGNSDEVMTFISVVSIVIAVIIIIAWGLYLSSG